MFAGEQTRGWINTPVSWLSALVWPRGRRESNFEESWARRRGLCYRTRDESVLGGRPGAPKRVHEPSYALCACSGPCPVAWEARTSRRIDAIGEGY